MNFITKIYDIIIVIVLYLLIYIDYISILITYLLNKLKIYKKEKECK